MDESIAIDTTVASNGDEAHVSNLDSMASPTSNTNGHDGDLSTSGDIEGKQSPTQLLRRSTRASALKAQEKLKVKENIDGGIDGRISSASTDPDAGGKRSAMSMHEHDGLTDDADAPPKKLRLADKMQLDQTDPHFAIQLNDDGQVILLSDDSEVSSLHDSEVDFVRKNYEKIVSRELTNEQKRERELMIMQLQAELRLEEAKLSMLKKIRMSQQIPPKQDPTSAKNRAGGQLTTGTPGNTAGNAYRPPVAQPANRVHNQVKGNVTNNSNSQRAPQMAHQGRPQVPPHVSNGRSMQTPTQNAVQQPLRGQQTAVQQQPVQSRSLGDSQTPAQRQAAAKLALRRQLEQQLLLIPAPRAPPPEMHFVPNHNQPDFCYLLGMDLAVQRVLKDKNATRGPKVPPYECVECGTDFTPVWKAVGQDEENGLTLKCESCVKAGEKKRLKAEHTSLLRAAFNKALQAEQELEKQIKEGKFDAPAVTAQSSPAVSQQPPPMVQHIPAPPHKSTSSSSLQQHHHHTPPQSQGAQAHHPAVQQLQTQKQRRPSPAPGASSSNNSGSSNQHSSSAQQQQQQAAAAAAQAAAFQRSIAQNPMFAAMLTGMNPMMQMPGLNNLNNMAGGLNSMANILQMGWNPSIAQRFPNLAMAALAQAAAAGQGGAGAMNAANAFMNSSNMMSKEMLKQIQQQQNLQRQMLMEMMPKQQQQQNQRPNK